MASDLNVDVKQGNITNDPEVKQEFDNGDKIVEFGLANKRSYQDSDGEWQDKTSFFNIKTTGQVAERVLENFEKGDRVIVQGRSQQERWENDNGDNRSRVVTRAYNVNKDGYPEGSDDPEEVMDDVEVDDIEDDISEVDATEDEDLFSGEKESVGL